jgi:oligopeptidase A
MYKKLVAARNYRAASMTLRQVHLAQTDLFLHSAAYDPAAHPEGVYASGALKPIDAAATVMPPLPEDRFLCSFAHIWAGGYSAGYYSYAWAEVMSADAFSAFEGPLAAKDEDEVRATGRRFRDTVLASGGGASPASVFEAFRGRGPTVDALLRQKGLVAGSAA